MFLHPFLWCSLVQKAVDFGGTTGPLWSAQESDPKLGPPLSQRQV